MAKERKIMIVAGEASGDVHAAKLVRALRAAEPDTTFEFFGAAGPKLRSEGVEAVVASDELSVVGLAEIGRALPMFIRASRALKSAADMRRPDVVILVDFPDFNLKLAPALKKKGFRVVYYISPQLWAWRKYRAATIRKYVDLLLTILPFEKDWYAEHGISNVEYVGNPLTNEVCPSMTKSDFCRINELDAAKPIAALLPGSRHKEIVRILPVMIDAALLLSRRAPEIQFIVPIESAKNRHDVETVLGDEKKGTIKVIEGQTYDALAAADVAAVTSGTATLETGIIGTPMVVVYKTSAINYGLLEPLISVDHYGLINLIAGERLAKELIQGNFTPGTLADELARLLDNGVNADMRKRLKAAVGKLGQGGASKRAAEAILRQIASPAQDRSR